MGTSAARAICDQHSLVTWLTEDGRLLALVPASVEGGALVTDWEPVPTESLSALRDWLGY